MNWEKLLRKRGFWVSFIGALFLISPIFLFINSGDFYWSDYFAGLGIWLLPSLMLFSAGILVWLYYLGSVPYYGVPLTGSIMLFSMLLSIVGWISFGVFLKNIKKVERSTLFKVLFFIILIVIITLIGCTKIDYPS